MDRYRLFHKAVTDGAPRGALAPDADAVLRSLMDAAIEAADADRGFLFVRRDGKLGCPVARRRSRKDIAIPTDEMSGRILEHAAEAGALLQEESTSESAARLGITRYLVVPLGGKGAVGFGYLDRLARRRPPFTLDQEAAVAELFEDMGGLVETLEEARSREVEGRRGAEDARRSHLFPEMVGRDPRLLAALADLEAAAATDVPVLVLGETGTGKELVARALLRLGKRSEQPYVAFNCAAVTRELADAEMFGHARGAFTGAASDRKGIFEEGDGGTVFLDEVGEMPPEIQAKLLRVLQSGEVRRVGEARTRRVDVRVVAATSRDLEAEAARGGFRRDLLYRLRVVTIVLPPLRERPGDVEALAHHFLHVLGKKHGRALAGFRRGALAAIASYRWPGNVRELENTIERAVVLARGSHVDVGDLRLGEAGAEAASAQVIPVEGPGGILTHAQIERAYFERLLELAQFNRSEVARLAGLPRTTLLAQLRKLGLLAAPAPRRRP